MAVYAPHNLKEKLFLALSGGNGWLGFKARKKLRRAYMARALAHFEGLERRLGADDICVDLGANYGTFTKRLATTGATVHAYEPDPDTFAELKNNVGHLPNVVLHQEAVAHEAGELTLHRLNADLASTPERRSWGSSLIASDRSSDGDSVEVQVISFDMLLERINAPISVMKMDIEGSEVKILQDIVAAPENYQIDAMFVETHERQRPEQLPDVIALRQGAASFEKPDIHLYWP